MVLKVKKERIYSKSWKSPYPAYIDPNARGTGYIIPYIYRIYTAVRHQIPLPGYRVSRVTRVSGIGSPWSPDPAPLPCAHIWVFSPGADHDPIFKIVKFEATAFAHNGDCGFI